MVDENFKKELKNQYCIFRDQINITKAHNFRCPKRKGMIYYTRSDLCAECREFMEDKDKDKEYIWKS